MMTTLANRQVIKVFFFITLVNIIDLALLIEKIYLIPLPLINQFAEIYGNEVMS